MKNKHVGATLLNNAAPWRIIRQGAASYNVRGKSQVIRHLYCFGVSPVYFLNTLEK